jgi:WD40 repeat protein
VLVGASDDGTVPRWDLANREQLEPIVIHKARVSAVVHLVDGKVLASASDDFGIWLSDAQKGRAFEKIAGHLGEVVALTASRDGQWLASGDRRGKVYVWRLRGGTILPEGQTEQPPPAVELAIAPVRALAFSADSKRLAAATEKEVLVWDVPPPLATGKSPPAAIQDPKPVARIDSGGPFLSIAWGATAGAPTLAIGCEDKTASLWAFEVKGARKVAVLAGHRGRLTALAFSPDGRRLAAGSSDVILWDVAARSEISTLRGEKWAVAAQDISPPVETLAP